MEYILFNENRTKNKTTGDKNCAKRIKFSWFSSTEKTINYFLSNFLILILLIF